MTAAEAQSHQQARLWSVAFAISALANVIVLLLMGLGLVPLDLKSKTLLPEPAEESETVATIVPEIAAPDVALLPAEPTPASPPKPPQAAPFARTSPDQAAERPENPSFIGERNTRATSDAAAVAQAPMLPSQKGREPHYENEVETTVSKYQDGDLASDRIAPPREGPAPDSEPSRERMSDPSQPPRAPAPPVDPALATQPDTPPPAPAPEPVVKETPAPAPDPGPAKPPAPPKERLAQGAVPVDRQVPEETPPTPPKPPAPNRRSASTETQPRETPPTPQQPKPNNAPKDAPGFRGNQQKTRINGSISRQGRSALDVEDSLLGKYHSSLSRAVEKEWQLNCVRNRDYITPGQIIVRFVLEPSGKVRSLTFLEEFGVGAIQKGFTSESIRTASIPPFPDELKKQLNGEPLEVTYSFTF